MSSPQASTVVGSDDDDSEPAQVPSPGQQGTQYDDRKFVKELLEACQCSNKQKKYNFEDYVVEKGEVWKMYTRKHGKRVASTGKKSYKDG